MFKVLILLITSAGVGYMLRHKSGLRKALSRTTPITIFILLFMFGLSIGSNESILSNIHKDGVKAWQEASRQQLHVSNLQIRKEG